MKQAIYLANIILDSQNGRRKMNQSKKISMDEESYSQFYCATKEMTEDFINGDLNSFMSNLTLIMEVATDLSKEGYWVKKFNDKVKAEQEEYMKVREAVLDLQHQGIIVESLKIDQKNYTITDGRLICGENQMGLDVPF